VLTRRDHAWHELTAFFPANARVSSDTLRAWRQPVLICEPHTMARDAEIAATLD
jgi:hypothetical protein